MKEAANIYIHVPFCRSKCPYCSFVSIPYQERAARSYLKALEEELRVSANDDTRLEPKTVYIGGGTPSILPQGQFERFIGVIKEAFCLDNCEEWTIEANPDSLNEHKIKAAGNAGVNRVSLGVQTIDECTLAGIGRNYSAGDVEKRIDCLRSNGIENIGIDLIAGLPGVTQESWRQTLEWICRAGIQHISVYALGIEPDCRWGREGVCPPGDEEMTEFLDIADGRLARNGFVHYEISNFAQPGFECLHNLNFWRGGDYRGLGPSASSRIGLKRWTNIADIADYVGRIGFGQSAVSEEETLNPGADAGERFAFALRLNEGVDLREFADKTGEDATGRMGEWQRKLAGLESEGLLWRESTRWRLSKLGRRFADRVAAAVI